MATDASLSTLRFAAEQDLVAIDATRQAGFQVAISRNEDDQQLENATVPSRL